MNFSMTLWFSFQIKIGERNNSDIKIGLRYFTLNKILVFTGQEDVGQVKKYLPHKSNELNSTTRTHNGPSHFVLPSPLSLRPLIIKIEKNLNL